jgi:hypothetical protein
MEAHIEEAEAFNPMERAIKGSRNVLSKTDTTTFTRRKAARRTESWYLATQPPLPQVRVPAKRKRITGQIGLQLPWYLASSPQPQGEDEDIPAPKKPRLDPVIKNEAALTYDVIDLCSDKTGAQLEADSQPSDYSVLFCGGKDNANHVGNRCFQSMCGTYVAKYSRTDNKSAKSVIVSEIITSFRQAGGNFFKHKEGAWCEVGDQYVRVKVSGVLRNMLHNEYRSSNKSKTAIRRASRMQSRNKPSAQNLVDGTEDSSLSGQNLVDGTGDSDTANSLVD